MKKKPTQKEQDFKRWERNESITRGRGGQPGNTNAMKHGIHASFFLAAEEKEIYDQLIAQFHEDFQFDKCSDFLQVEQVCINYVKLGRAQVSGDWDTAEKIDRIIRANLKDLKTTRIVRDEDPKLSQGSQADWATDLLERAGKLEKDD